MKHSATTSILVLACGVLLGLSLSGCDALAGDDPTTNGTGAVGEGGVDGTSGPISAVPGDDAGIPEAGVGVGVPGDAGPCVTTFRYVPAAGKMVKTVAVSGEWNGFAPGGTPLKGPDSQGAFVGSVELKPGLVAYKLIVDGIFGLDPQAGLRKYVGSVENSAVRVTDCHVPTFSAPKLAVTRPSSGQGHFHADVALSANVDPPSVKATLRKDGTVTPITGVAFDPKTSKVALDLPGLADGKYTVFLDATDKAGNKAKAQRLVFWIEGSEFLWNDAVIYMAMTDRFKDGDPTNNPAATANVDSRADFAGGDLQGVRMAIADGSFDKLGIRALWLSPFHENPKAPYVAGDSVHMTMGYHGYWPVKPRSVDPRFGGDQALKDLVKEAHAHGIRVLQDFVVNHVHKEHEYFAAHPDWFRTGCVCGTNNCDWTTHRLDCLFADYLPDVNWTVPAVAEQYAADAIYWLDTFDLDGLRVDAVKHVEDLAVTNMAAAIRGEFEASGTKVFLTGETAMGWSDCGLGCNADQYGTISRYVGPLGLDGQADFVLYHAVPYRSFSSTGKGLIHAGYWAEQSSPGAGNYPDGAIMTPYIGSHDTARFATLATYRGQDAAHDPGLPGNQWNNYVSIAPDAEAYGRHQAALAWLLGQPGAPMIYYGDEYGQWGGADPNNRVMWRGSGTLSADEQATLTLTRALGTARKNLPALRRGAYKAVSASEDVLVFGRQIPGGDTALIAVSRLPASTTYKATLPAGLLPEGTTLHDRLGGADAVVTGGAVTVSLGAHGAAILAP